MIVLSYILDFTFSLPYASALLKLLNDEVIAWLFPLLCEKTLLWVEKGEGILLGAAFCCSYCPKG